MSEITRAPYPAEPVAPDVVTRYWELHRKFYENTNSLEKLLPYPDRNENTPDPRLLATDSVENRSWSTGEVVYQATQAERLAVFEECARERIAEIEQRVIDAREFLAHYEANRDEIEAYNRERKSWKKTCDEIDTAYREAVWEERREKDRARYVVGTRVNVYRARHSWEIIARNGKGAIIREIRYDDKPARIRELADVLEVN